MVKVGVSRQRQWRCARVYWLGFKPKEKAMKKKFSDLSKEEQEEIELWYHNMDPHEFDDLMRGAKLHPGIKPRPKSSKKVSRKAQTAPKQQPSNKSTS